MVIKAVGEDEIDVKVPVSVFREVPVLRGDWPRLLVWTNSGVLDKAGFRGAM